MKDPPKIWTQMSKKKKVKYMDSMKLLYGDKHAKEGNEQVKDSNSYGETGANKIIHLVKKE